MVDIRDWSVLHVGGIGDGRMGVPEHARSNIIPQNDCWAVLSAPLGEAGTAVEIAGVVLVGVGFALETDVAVGVAFAEQPPYPLQLYPLLLVNQLPLFLFYIYVFQLCL